MIGKPLFAIEPVPWDPPPVDEFDGLLIGSANAIRQAGHGLALFRGMDVYAVGGATANEAEKAGLNIRAVGEGGLQALLDSLVPAPLSLLRLAGLDHVALNPPANITIEKRIVYRAYSHELPQSIADRLADGGIVMLHSAAAADHFSQECSRLNVNKANITNSCSRFPNCRCGRYGLGGCFISRYSQRNRFAGAGAGLVP